MLFFFFLFQAFSSHLLFFNTIQITNNFNLKSVIIFSTNLTSSEINNELRSTSTPALSKLIHKYVYFKIQNRTFYDY